MRAKKEKAGGKRKRECNSGVRSRPTFRQVSKDTRIRKSGAAMRRERRSQAAFFYGFARFVSRSILRAKRQLFRAQQLFLRGCANRCAQQLVSSALDGVVYL